MKISRGLAALILIIFFQSTLLAEYLYKDEVIYNPRFNTTIETLGKELYEKTGISLRLLMLREIPDGIHIIEYEKELLKKFNKPTILLTFSELNSKVDILANDTSLYKYFNKNQVLSPVASPVQAFVMAIIYARSIENFKVMISNSGGTILPLLAGKAKKGELLGKYSASMFNGYLDIAEQIASSKGVKLINGTNDANQKSIFAVKTLFYGIILISLLVYFKKRFFSRRQKSE